MKKTPDIIWKICGMRDSQNVWAVAELQPNYMGFIFYKDSPRFVGNQFEVPANLPTSMKRVGVFVNESLDRVLALVQKHRLDFVQLHGDEPVGYAEALKKITGVIKVFRVDEDFDFSATAEFETVSDFFLFDTKGTYFGGNAIQFDWNLLQKYVGNVPFFLSGGISPSTIQDLESFSHQKFYALDINSGVEEQPAFKSVEKIKDLLHSLEKIRRKH